MGGVVERNVLEDTEQGGVVGVEHTEAVKSNKGRSYMSMQLRDNVVRWTEPFVSARLRSGGKEPLVGLTMNTAPSADPFELLVTASGNSLDAPIGYRDMPGAILAFIVQAAGRQ